MKLQPGDRIRIYDYPSGPGYARTYLEGEVEELQGRRWLVRVTRMVWDGSELKYRSPAYVHLPTNWVEEWVTVRVELV